MKNSETSPGTPETIKDLKSRIKVLEEENALLTERSEEVNLMRHVNESINTNVKLDKIIENILEVTSIILDIPLGIFCDIKKGKIKQQISYAAFSDDDKTNKAVHISEKILKQALKDHIHLLPYPAKKQDLHIEFSTDKFQANEVLIIPVSEKFAKHKIFIFVGAPDSGKLKSSKLILLSIVNLIGYKIQQINLHNTMKEEIKFRKQIEENLRELTHIDELTGLHNRRFFDAFSENMLNQCRRFGETFSLVLIDIDNFKQINDSFGHSEGDLVLAEIAKLFREHTRKSDIVARYGGEEFIILCPHHDASSSEIMAEKIRIIVEKSQLSKSAQVTISLGVTTFRPAKSINDLFGECDKALYQAKKLGKNKAVLYS